MNSQTELGESKRRAILQEALRNYLGDRSPTLLGYEITEREHSGTSTNSEFLEAKITYQEAGATSPKSVIWLIKKWQPGETAFEELESSRPIEALAWQDGLLRPGSLPHGVTTPFISANVAENGLTGWVFMKDIADALRQYDRDRPLASPELVARVRQILSRLARFHVWGEQLAEEEALEQYDWLPSHESYLWRGTNAYKKVLARKPDTQIGESELTSTTFVDNLYTFLATLAAQDREHWEELLCNRQPLVDGLADVPSTILHNDLDDRNIGLHHSAWGESGEYELVLIDWEWMATGPAALDVAKVLHFLPGICAMDSPCPESLWTHELPAYYFEQYQAEGGNTLDEGTWNRSYELALVTQAMSPFPAVAGHIRRTLDGLAPLPEYPGMSENIIRDGLTVIDERLKSMAATASRIMDRFLL